MRIMAAVAGKPSAWNRLTEVISVGPSPSHALPDAVASEDSPLPDDSGDLTGSTHVATKATGWATTDTSDIPAEDVSNVKSLEVFGKEHKVEDAEKTRGVSKDLATTGATTHYKTDNDSEVSTKTEPKPRASTDSNDSDDSESAILVESTQTSEADVGAVKRPSSVPDAKKPDNQKADSEAATPTRPASLSKLIAAEGKSDGKTPAAMITDTESKASSEPSRAKGNVKATARARSSSPDKQNDPMQRQVSTKAVPAKYQVRDIPVRASKAAPAPAIKSAMAEPKKARVMDDLEIEQARLDRQEKLDMMRVEKEQMADLRAHQRKLETDSRAEDMKRQTEDRDEQRQLRQEKRNHDAARRVAAQKAIDDAVMRNKESLTLAQLEAVRNQNQFADRFSGVESTDQTYVFDASSARGPSQTVTYSSRFVDKLTDITDDMIISGALTVKMARIGGSGRGSFVNSDKFMDSDLNFYISVKVTNQTTNFKDALIFNPMRSIDIGSEDFNKVYGDSYISSFQEGGDFNAIISMKIHNKAKLMDIKSKGDGRLDGRTR